MAKIADAVRPNTAAKIASEHRAIAEVEHEIANLRAAQAGKLLDDAPDDAIKLGEKIIFAERRLAVHQQRLAALQKHKRVETTVSRQQQKAAALADLEKKLTARAATAALVDKTLNEFVAALAAYRADCRAPFEAWPDTFPPIKLFESYVYSYAESRIGGALHMNTGAAVELFAALPRRVGSLAEKDVQISASILEDIRTAPLPPLPETEGEAA